MEHNKAECCCVECCYERPQRALLRRTGSIRRSKPKRRYHDRRTDEERRRMPVQDHVRKILITGDRNWDDIPRVVEALRGYRPGTVLVNGACRGADIICAAVAEALGFEVRNYPADWVRRKKAAGPIRNREMLTKEHRPEEPIDLVLAFHNDIENSKGTADMLDCVVKANIPWELITSHDTRTPGPSQGMMGVHDTEKDLVGDSDVGDGPGLPDRSA